MDPQRRGRQQLSAYKARVRFAEHGRGLMLSQIVRHGDADAPPVPIDDRGRWYRNIYVPIADLTDADTDLLRLVNEYDPITQAVVVIEYEPGCRLETEIIQILDGDWSRETTTH